MKALKYKLFFLLLLCISSTSYDQRCKDFFKTKNFRIYKPGKFQLYGQSKVFEIELHRTYKFDIVFYGKSEYMMGVSTETGFEPVRFRMINNEKNQVLYDNAKYQFKETVNFYIENPQTITIEVVIVANKEPYSIPDDMLICLGIKIMSQTIY